MTFRSRSQWSLAFEGRQIPLGVLVVLLTGKFLLTNSAVMANEGMTNGTPVQIRMLEQAEVNRGQVLLGDVAIVSTTDLPRLKQLMLMPIGSAPRSGEIIRLSRDRLKNWASSRLGLAAANIEWSGPETVSVKLAKQLLHGELIYSVPQESLISALAKNGLRGEIHPAQSVNDIVVPAGDLRLAARPQASLQTTTPTYRGNPVFGKHHSIWVDVWVDDVFFRTVSVGVDVDVFAPAFIATRDFAVGERVKANIAASPSLAIRDVDWYSQIATPIRASKRLEDPNLAELQIIRPIAAGQALTRANTSRAPQVVHGSYATLRLNNGPIQLERRVEVLEDGVVGQMVRVKLPNGANSMLAQVTGPGFLEAN